MYIILVIVFSVAVAIWHYYSNYLSKPVTSPGTGLQTLRELKDEHHVRSAFLALVDDDGAGQWPPRANHDDFPPALRPYQQIYATMAPLLATAEPSMDDELNVKRCQEFRSRLQALLAAQIDLGAVEKALVTVEAGNWDYFPRDVYNGFYSCIACLRHAYRWATNPVVRVAQNEKDLSFPQELDLPWSYIQRRFGITSPSGNIMANAVLNFDNRGQLVYLVNEGMSELVLRTEHAWNRIFVDSEILGIPLYCAMIQAIISYDRGDRASALAHTEASLQQLRIVMKNLYEKMNDPHVARSVWVRHVSGIHSWGLVHESKEGPLEYGGLSGSQILTFLAVDSFLGIDRYHTDQEMEMHISTNMRRVCEAFSQCSFRRQLSGKLEGDVAIRDVMDRMVKQLRNFRAFHKVRAVQYLSAPAPERVPMTAALSVLQEDEEKKAKVENPYEAIEGILIKRLNETM